MFNNLTKKVALYCCASTLAIASMPDEKYFATPQHWIATQYAFLPPETQNTVIDALAATGLVLCANPLINASTTGKIWASPRVLWSGSCIMATTVIPSVIATTAFTQMYVNYSGRKLNTLESCIIPAIGGMLGAHVIQPLDTLATWKHIDSTKSMLQQKKQSTAFWCAGRRSLGWREFFYSAGWSGFAPIGTQFFAPYLSETNAKIAGGVTVGALMGLLTTPIHNAKVEAQILSFTGQHIPTNRVIYQQLFEQRKLFKGWKFRVPLTMGAIWWMSTVPGLITAPPCNR